MTGPLRTHLELTKSRALNIFSSSVGYFVNTRFLYSNSFGNLEKNVINKKNSLQSKLGYCHNFFLNSYFVLEKRKHIYIISGKYICTIM